MPTYYQRHCEELKKLLDAKLDLVKSAQHQPSLFEDTVSSELFTHIEKEAMRYPLRHYQEKSLFMLSVLLEEKGHPVFEELKEEIEIEEHGVKKPEKIPFATFEMATGSGKTLAMGAMMLYLHKRYNVRNFLIITPPAKMEIYTKTIRNFEKNTSETVWAEDLEHDFNIITGDNYNQQSMFSGDKDFNIFIFNIDKFRVGATKTQEPNENSAWRDVQGNLISLQDYLRGKKLVIFTDEAHHNQNKSGALQIIKNFLPQLVLEFTATAREEEKDKKSQKVVYKYNIKHLLEDKYCKIVKAFGISSELRGKSKEILTLNEKIKLLSILLVHLGKRHCLQFDPAVRDLKPLSFIKINRAIEDGEKVFNYLKTELLDDNDVFEMAIKEISKEPSEIIEVLDKLLKGQYKDRSILKSDLKKIIDNAIYYHSNSPKEVKDTYGKILYKGNPCELVLYCKILDEGIDMPNIYTIGVINDVDTNLLTPVKQVIGRGVRLNKSTREFDDDTDIFRTQTEKIHIVCDKDKNFEKVIQQIQNEFGISDKYLGIDKTIQDELNLGDSSKLEGKYFPKIKAELKTRAGANIFNLMGNTERVTGDFVKYNCFHDDAKTFFKFVPESLFTIVDMFSDPKTIRGQILKNGGEEAVLVLSDKNRSDIYKRIIKSLNTVPNIKKIEDFFAKYAEIFDQMPLYYHRRDEDDLAICQNKFVDTFCFFYKNYIESNYFDLRYSDEQDDSFYMTKLFKEINIKRILDDKNVNKYIKANEEQKLVEVIKAGYFFSKEKNFKNSFYKYVKFDSLAEYKTAFILDNIIKSSLGSGKENYWIRNDRQIYFEYGSHKYYPDFLLRLNDSWFVFETKGEKFSLKLKNLLLDRLNSMEGYKGILLYEKAIDVILEKELFSIEKVMEVAKNCEVRVENAKRNLFDAVAETVSSAILESLTFIEDFKNRMFKDLLPVYTIEAACGKFCENREDVECKGWVEVKDKKLTKDMFICRTIGKSMEPIIPEGSLCVFQYNPAGSRNGQTVLVQHKGIKFPDTKTSQTIKLYFSEKSEDGDLWKHNKIVLKSRNREYEDFTFEDVSSDFDSEFKVAGLLVGMYDTESKSISRVKL